MTPQWLAHAVDTINIKQMKIIKDDMFSQRDVRVHLQRKYTCGYPLSYSLNFIHYTLLINSWSSTGTVMQPQAHPMMLLASIWYCFLGHELQALPSDKTRVQNITIPLPESFKQENHKSELESKIFVDCCKRFRVGVITFKK